MMEGGRQDCVERHLAAEVAAVELQKAVPSGRVHGGALQLDHLADVCRAAHCDEADFDLPIPPLDFTELVGQAPLVPVAHAFSWIDRFISALYERARRFPIDRSECLGARFRAPVP